MSKCKKCDKIAEDFMLVCPNCGANICPTCAGVTQNICPYCYSTLDFLI